MLCKVTHCACTFPSPRKTSCIKPNDKSCGMIWRIPFCAFCIESPWICWEGCLYWYKDLKLGILFLQWTSDFHPSQAAWRDHTNQLDVLSNGYSRSIFCWSNLTMLIMGVAWSSSGHVESYICTLQLATACTIVDQLINVCSWRSVLVSQEIQSRPTLIRVNWIYYSGIKLASNFDLPLINFASRFNPLLQMFGATSTKYE